MNSVISNRMSPWMLTGLSLLIWMSPMFDLGIFFSIGVLFAFPHSLLLKRKALAIILIYVSSWILFYPLELLHRFGQEWETFLNTKLVEEDYSSLAKLGIVFFVAVLLFFNYVHSSSRQNRREKIRNESYKQRFPDLTRPKGKPIKDSRFDTFLLVFFLSLFLTLGLHLLLEKIHPSAARNQMAPLSELFQFYFNYLTSNAILLLSFSKHKTPSLFSRWFLRYQKGIRLREAWKQSYLKNEKFPFLKEIEIRKRAFFRDRILPGWGHVYVEDYWRGFPILFVSLLLWLFFAVWTFSYISPIFGLQFLGGMGLKPGIPDKDFFITSQNIAYSIMTVLGLVLLYGYSSHLLGRTFSLENLGLKKAGDKELDPVFEAGIRRGFRNTLPVSLLLHLILICLVFIIPVTLQRSSQKKDKSSEKSNHFQPEKMEFYFIDPNVPDQMEGLNGGVITGNDAKDEKQGEKISNEKTADNGPKAGFVKRIKGKKVPPTYSNYISAKMRIPESYMDYWANAPHPYSSVVAYTITQEGDIIDIEMVEGSSYPDQDLKTLQLIENLGPLLPPPNTKSDIRVTELFWNGPIDPEFVPTPLQKEMINLFDGRYMEELPE
ncbi:energy transducer TonB [Leptospira idonii]|uniref:Energy transducer TonB n=1 Tax=Leptospira idonii TaxID=1193500 RepID=A0A4R9M470_9LEPT|nr:energy transducer TonB [Leptospira idonii]TGN20771.1 energy transducer TonB [Leptospira idonii]